MYKPNHNLVNSLSDIHIKYIDFICHQVVDACEFMSITACALYTTCCHFKHVNNACKYCSYTQESDVTLIEAVHEMHGGGLYPNEEH